MHLIAFCKFSCYCSWGDLVGNGWPDCTPLLSQPPPFIQQLFSLGQDLLHWSSNCSTVKRKECEEIAINNKVGNPLQGELLPHENLLQRSNEALLHLTSYQVIAQKVIPR